MMMASMLPTGGGAEASSGKDGVAASDAMLWDGNAAAAWPGGAGLSEDWTALMAQFTAAMGGAAAAGSTAGKGGSSAAATMMSLFNGLSGIAQEKQAYCSVHNKQRKMQYLEDMGNGRYRCVAGSECQSAGPPSIKKTMCKFFLQGACNRGQQCAFAHSEEEIGQPIPEDTIEALKEQTVAGKGGRIGTPWTEEAPEKALCSLHSKMRSKVCLQDAGDGTYFCKPGNECKGSSLKDTPCKFYLQGRCTKGEDCPFRHDEKMLEMAGGISGGAGSSRGMWEKGMAKGMMGMMSWMNPMMKGGWGDDSWWGGSGGSSGGKAGGGCGEGSSGRMTCSVHGKQRSVMNLQEAPDGSWTCKPGFECKGYSSSGADWFAGSAGDYSDWSQGPVIGAPAGGKDHGGKGMGKGFGGRYSPY